MYHSAKNWINPSKLTVIHYFHRIGTTPPFIFNFAFISADFLGHPYRYNKQENKNDPITTHLLGTVSQL